MIRRVIAIAALFLAASTAQAQTIVTRSGEHEGFSRLVMRLPNQAEWSLTQSGRVATLNLDAPSAVFDTSSVFNLIPKTRLQKISQQTPGGPLRLELGCECRVTSYMQSDGYLVLDIRDGAPSTRVVQSAPISTPTPQAGYRFNLPKNAIADARQALRNSTEFARSQNQPSAQMADGVQKQAEMPVDKNEEIPLLFPIEIQAAGAQEPEAIPEQNHPEINPAAVNLLIDLEETARAARINASEARLLQQIGRAANQGLLDVNVAVSDEESGFLDPLGRQERPLNPLENISITSAIDRETGLMARFKEEDGRLDHCLPDRKLALHKWGNDSSFGDQIGPLRGALVREFDDLNPATVKAMAKLYLFFGFGAEAKAMIDMLPKGAVDSQSREIMLSFATLLDGGELPEDHVFSGQQFCEGDAAFWSMLADGEIRKSANTDAIQQVFARLPAHLRVHFGPQVGELFAKVGEHHIADATLRAVDRTGVQDVPSMNLAEAAIAEMKGDTETVAEKLTEEVAERTENAPDALIDLIDLSFAERKALSPDVPDLAASYELESRDTELGARLRTAEVSSLALVGRFEEAFHELAKLTTMDGPTARVAAIEPLMTLLAERADDVTFLQYSLVFAQQSTAAEATPVAEILARRLLDLGFAEQAKNLLHKLALEPENESRRLMMAEAALGLNKPHAALVELMGLEGPKANLLRAEALWRNGEYGRAGEYMLEASELNAAARGFWHSEELDAAQQVNTEGPVPFGEVATVTTQISETSRDPEGLTPLAHARALMESSQNTRGGIADLLNRVETAAEPETTDQ